MLAAAPTGKGDTVWAAQRVGSAFPYGTLIVNLAGCFLIAAVMHAALTLGWSVNLRAALTIGFMGGLTTYSSWRESAPLVLHRRGDVHDRPERSGVWPFLH